MSEYNNGSDFLFARPSALEGAARLLDLGGTINEYNRALIPEQADYLALRNDWRIIADDLKRAALELADRYEREARGAPKE